MNLREFLHEVLPTQGNYFTVQITSAGTTRQFQHVDLPQVAASVYNITQRHNNAYIAQGGFGAKRTQAACKLKRAWYVDIDCKPGGNYETKREGMAAIKAALRSGLPPFSLLVDSGNGFHPYWVCTEDVARSDWKSYAKALTAACKQHNLNIDSSCTEDEARILRAPDSVNYKDPHNPKPCRVVKDTSRRYSFNAFAAAFNQYLTGPATVGTVTVDNSDLYEGLDSKDAKASTMLELCPVFRNTAATHGEHDSEPLWHKIIHTLVYCDDGANFIHPLSDKHPGYSPQKTDRKYAHSLRNKERTGAVTCQKFSELSNECASCPWAGRINSPIKLAFGEPNELPFPYRNAERCVEKKSEDGWDKAIRYTVKDLDAVINPGEETTVSLVIGEAHITTTLDKIVVDNRSCNTLLSNYGVSMDTHELEELRRLMNAWMHQLQEAKKVHVGTDNFGWLSEGNFHYAGLVYSAHGSTPTRVPDKNMAAVFSPHGALEPWQACANHILAQPRYASWAVIASAFAAPLLRFTGVSGTVLSIVSQNTGTGKSTAMQIGAGVWGSPKSSMSSLDDTPNSVANRLGMLNTLPAYWDEVREKDHVQRFITNVFRLSQGREKTRLNVNIQQRKAGEWDTMLIIASNDPLKDHISHVISNSDAGVARVFELRAEAIQADGMSDGAARHFYSQLKDNYGHAGRVYAEWIAPNHAKAKKLVCDIDNQLSTRLNTGQDERFWVATSAALIAGAQIATDLGICKFDMAKFKRYLVTKLLAMRTTKQEEYRAPLDLSIDLVMRYLHEHKEYIIRAKHMPRRGRGNEILLDSDRHPAVIRYAIDDGIVRIILNDFERWYYKESGSGHSHIVDNLVNNGATTLRGSVDAGTALGTGGRFRCIDINYRSSAFSVLAPDD